MRELGDRVVTGRGAYFVVGITFLFVFLAAVLAVWFGSPELKQAGGQTLTTSLIGFLTTFLLNVNAKERERVQKLHEAERAMLTQQLEHAFSVGSSSHMANVAFDKHVNFCEAYAAELRKTLAGLLDHKRRSEAFDQAKRLTALRQAQALWLTKQMEAPLEKIERKLRWIGGGHLIADESGAPEAERNEVRQKISELFIEVLGEELGREPESDEISIGNIVRGLGRVLGVDDLTQLRQKILRNAAATGTGKP